MFYSEWRAAKRRHEVFNVDLKKIIYCYSEYQEAFDLVKDPCVEFTNSLADLESKLEPYTLCIIDDLMAEVETTYNSFVTALFTKKIHHQKLGKIPMQRIYAQFPLIVHLWP